MKRTFTSQTTQVVNPASSGLKRSRTYSKYGARKPAKKKAQISLLASKNPTGFPKRMLMRHRYADSKFVTGTTGAVAHLRIRANGMFDPNITDTGHQPYYFDQMTAIYDHFTVLKAWIKVTFARANTDLPTTCGVYLNDDSTTTPATLTALQEISGAKWAVMPTGAGDPIVMWHKFDAKEVFGGSILGNDNLQGTAAADPTEQQVWDIFVGAADAASTVSMAIVVDVYYTAVWDELKDIDQS